MALTLSNTFLQRKPSPPTLSVDKVRAVGPSRPQWTCRKKDIHPKFYEKAKVYCNNELVMTTGGTKEEYVVDVWSGNHPFYLGSRSQLLIDADQVEKFRKKYGELTQIMEIPVLKGEIIIPPRRKSGSGKGGKKKTSHVEGTRRCLKLCPEAVLHVHPYEFVRRKLSTKAFDDCGQRGTR